MFHYGLHPSGCGSFNYSFMLRVKIKNLSKNQLPAYETDLSAGMDLRANLASSIVLFPKQRLLIPTGISIELPAGYDMSTNANLLIVKQKALEKEKEWLDFCKDEYKLMKKQDDEIKAIARRERIYRPEVYERWFNK